MSLPTAQSARTDLTLTREAGGGFGSFAIPASSGCCYYIDGAAGSNLQVGHSEVNTPTRQSRSN